ncbi:MAG: Biopolymer transport protein ExbD/TolR, partial [Myxococcaceae bacterium]|nr:Biopolymer transport protein ExbD/TolR [Myxococcaceae bacterium]
IISADQSLNYGRVMGLIDVIKGKGIAKFALNIQKGAAPAAPSPAPGP